MTNCITQLWLRKLLPFTVSLFYQKPYAFVNCRLFQTPGIFMRKYGPFPCRMTNFTGVPSILKAHHHFPDHTSIPKTPVSGQTTLPPTTHLHPFEFPCISLYHKSRRAHCLKRPTADFCNSVRIGGSPAPHRYQGRIYVVKKVCLHILYHLQALLFFNHSPAQMRHCCSFGSGSKP